MGWKYLIAPQPKQRQIYFFWSFIKIWSAVSKILCVTDGGMERWMSADPRSHCGGQQYYQRLINQIIWQMVWRNYFPHWTFSDEPPCLWWNWASALDLSSFIVSNEKRKPWERRNGPALVEDWKREQKNDGKILLSPLWMWYDRSLVILLCGILLERRIRLGLPLWLPW